MSSSINPPSNKDIKDVLEKGKETVHNLQQKGEEFHVLQPAGKNVLTDTEQLLVDAQLLIDKKNRDDRLQRFIQCTAKLIEDLKDQPLQQASSQLQNVQREMKAHFSEYAQQDKEIMLSILASAKDLVYQLFTSSDFRGLLIDVVDLVQDFLNSASEDVKQKIIEETQPEQQEEHKAEKGKHVLQKQQQQQQQPEERITSVERSQHIYTVDRSTPMSVNPFSFSTGTPKWDENLPAEHQPILQMPVAEAEKAEKAPESSKPTSAAASYSKGESVGDRLSQKTQETLSEAHKLFNERLNKILDRLNSNPKFNEAFQSFISLLRNLESQIEAVGEEISEKSAEAAKQGTKSLQKLANNKEVQEWGKQARDIIEGFTGKGTWDSFYQELQAFVSSIKKDERAQAYFTEWREYIHDAITDTNNLKNEKFRNKAFALWKRGESLAKELKWKTSSQRLFDSWKQMAYNVDHDPLMLKLRQDAKKLALDTVLNAEGKLVYRPELVEQMRTLFVKMFTEALKRIPIPFVNDSFHVPLFGEVEYEIDEWAFSGYDLLPEHMQIKMDNDIDFNLKSLQTNTVTSTVLVRIKNMRAELKDIHFKYRQRLEPHISDNGYLNVTIGGEGTELLVTIHVKPPSEGNTRDIFEVKEIKCIIDELAVSTHDSSFGLVYSLLSGLFAGSMRTMVEKKVEDTLTGLIANINNGLNELIDIANSNKDTSLAIGEQLQSYAKSLIGDVAASPQVEAIKELVKTSPS